MAHRKIRIPSTELRTLAADTLGAHERLLADGYALSASSGVWRQADGSVTARFVYRRRELREGIAAIAYTVRTRAPLP